VVESMHILWALDMKKFHTHNNYYESRTQGTQSAYIGQNNTEKIY